MTTRKTASNVDSLAVPTITQITFRMGATVPTGDYQNIQPMIEMIVNIPDGATPPDNAQMMERLQHEMALGVLPSIQMITETIDLEPFVTAKINDLKAPSNIKAVSVAYAAACPMFKWLSMVDRALARQFVVDAIQAYIDEAESIRVYESDPLK